MLLGEPTDELGGSEYLHVIHGVVAGAPPRCDLRAEKSLIDALLSAIAGGAVRSAHDCSDGGLYVALAECCIGDKRTPVGADVDLSAYGDVSLRALLFGEAQGRIVLSSSRPARVMRFTLDKYGERIVRAEIVDRNWKIADEPTIGTIVGNDFVYVANSQWEKYNDSGARNARMLTAPVLLALPLDR